jgi:hypothetical protein
MHTTAWRGRDRLQRDEYSHIRAYMERALRRGWPRVLILDSRGVNARRDRLLTGRATRRGLDRDEYPPAIGRGKGPHVNVHGGGRVAR